MYPVLFYLGSVPIWSYGTFIALGMIALFALALISARREGRRWEHLLPIAMGVLVGGAFGARLSHLIVEPGIEADVFSSLLPEDTTALCTDEVSHRLDDHDEEIARVPQTCTWEHAARELFALTDKPGRAW